MRSTRLIISRVLGMLGALSLLSACGGGGGGGGGGNPEGDSPYGVRVLHAAIDGAPVDISSSAAAGPLLSQQVFAGTKGYRALPGGAQRLSLTRTGTPSDVYSSFAVNAASDDRYTILLYGDVATFGLRTRLLQDEVPTTGGEAWIRVVNGVTQAADLTVTVGASPAQAIPFGGDTGYVSASPGAINVSASRTTDGYPVQSGAVTVEAGKAYTLLLAGEIGYYVKSLLFTDGR
jgi:hypothetical protein